MLVKTLAETTVKGAVQPAGHMGYWRNYFGAAAEIQEGPQAFMVVVLPNAPTRAHFHPINQFQIFFGTPGSTFGRKAVAPVYVHYVDGYTPYGPFAGGPQGMEFFTLRAVHSKGLYYMPEQREKLIRKAGRTIHVDVEPEQIGAEVEVRPLVERHADGLGAWFMSVGPEQSVTGPRPEGAGQYYLITKGMAHLGERALPEKSLLFVNAGEPAPELSAKGTLGFQAVVVQYPEGPQG